jgi:hypothetical protein
LDSRHEGEKSYEMATLLIVEWRVGECVLSISDNLEHGCMPQKRRLRVR